MYRLDAGDQTFTREVGLGSNRFNVTFSAKLLYITNGNRKFKTAQHRFLAVLRLPCQH